MKYLEENLGEGQVLAMAKTGKAATVINGSDIYNKRSGLALPVARKVKWTKLDSQRRMEMKQTHQNVRIVFIDEYYMLKQKYLWIINKRLQEIKGNNIIFGGVVLVLVGDTAQLPPVQVNPLWHQAQEGDSLLLQQLYFNQFRSVIELNEKNRLDAADESSVWFAGFLNRLADAEVTLDHFNSLRDTCSNHKMGNEKWTDLGICKF